MPTPNASDNRGQLPIIQQSGGSSGNKPKAKKSGRGKTRAAVLIFIHVVILLHISHYLTAGRTVSPIEPSEAMYTLNFGHLNAGAIFFGLAILSTAIFGRFFCGWGCHIVALQDLCSHVLRRIGLRPKPLRSRLLALVPFGAAFYMFFWPTLNRLMNEKPHPGFTNHLMTDNFWQTFPGPVIAVLTFVVCGGVIVYFLGNKGFCTYACPYGAFFNVADQLAVGRIRVTDACEHCGQCTASCTSNVMVHAEVKEFGQVVDPGCMKCMDCVSVCPNDALYFGFTDRRSGAAKTDGKANSKPAKKKPYDFSIWEELVASVVAVVSLIAFRGVYGPGRLPLLLSIALGVLTAYLAIQFFRIFSKRDFRIQNFRLKRDNKVTSVGRIAILAIGAWLLFGVHSSFVQYHRYVGRTHLNRIDAQWSELLAGQAFRDRLTDVDRANLNQAVRSYQCSDRFGLINVAEIKLGLIFANMMKGDMEASEKYLREAYACQAEPARKMLAEFLASQDRQEEAEKILLEAPPRQYVP